MILTTYDVDIEIQWRMLGLEYRHTDRETGVVDWDAYEEEQKKIIHESWEKQGEIMRAQFASEMEDAEDRVDADLRHAEFMCSQKTQSSNYPIWTFPVIILAIYLIVKMSVA